MKLFAAALALTLGLAGCGPVDGDPIRSGASAPDNVPRQDAVTVAQLRQQAEQNGSLAVVLYLGSVPERTADVDAALDSLQEQPWQFVTDIPADHRVTAPGGGRELYCLFAVSSRDTLFLYEKQDPQYPHQTGWELYCGRDGQPVLLLENRMRLPGHGFLGIRFFERFRVIFDFRRSRLRIAEPLSAADTRAAGPDCSRTVPGSPDATRFLCVKSR